MLFTHQNVEQLITTYGYGVVVALNFVESFGIPVPGETALIAAAIYAGTTHKLSIYLLLGATVAGTIVGDILCFLLGGWVGFWFLTHHGKRVGLHERRIRLGQYLFMRYGSAIVFLVRFLPVLRGLIAFLAGANQMTWRRFLVSAGAGTLLWVTAFGIVPFWLGKAANHLARPVWISLICVAVVAVVAAGVFLHRNEARLEDEAEKALPGPVGPLRGRHKES
jgi:membrane protein DedA with SNARE-associated domain